MSNCCANSASVLSPRTAAKATFALKAGVWFRRGRFVMVSPVRHTSWPLSGRNSTYPAVQISKASSEAQEATVPVEPEKPADEITKWTLRIPAELMALVEKDEESLREEV